LPFSGTAQKVQTIQAGNGLKTEKPVFLKDVAQEIEYIRLETTDKCLIGGAGHLIAADADNIIVADKGFYRFGRDGKFKNTISGRGKGPGEYVEIAGFEIDRNTGSFFVFDRLGKVIEFRLNGELISDQRVSSALYVTLFGEDKVLNLYSSRLTMLSGGYRVVITDRKGNPVKKMLKVDQESLDNIQNLTVQNSRLSGYRDSITVWEGLCDTVYRISNDFNITPRFLLDLGKDRLPRVLRVTPNSPDYRQEIDKYIMPLRFFETGRHLFLESSYHGKQKLQV
jgi:hypothetical protein